MSEVREGVGTGMTETVQLILLTCPHCGSEGGYQRCFTCPDWKKYVCVECGETFKLTKDGTVEKDV